MRRLLTYRRARMLAFVLVALYAAAWVFEIRAGTAPLNAAGVPRVGDYVAFHTAGLLVLSGHAASLYDQSAVTAVQAQLLNGRIAPFYDAFRNPPFFALPFVPLATLPLVWGFVVWTLLSLACLGAAVWMLLNPACVGVADAPPLSPAGVGVADAPPLSPTGVGVADAPLHARWRGVLLLHAWWRGMLLLRERWPGVRLLRERWPGVLLLVAAFAPVYFGLVDGENAALSLLLYVLLFRSLFRGADVEAGVWSALGLFKPQLFLVFPFILLARRAWRGLLSYVICAVALGLVSLALVGPDGMVAWFRTIFDTEAGNSAANAWRMASLSSLFELALPGAASIAFALYAVCAVALLALVMWLWSADRVAPHMTWAVTCLAAVLIDPHLVDYDLTILVSGGVLLLAHDARPMHRWLVAALYVSTLLRPELPIASAGVLITPLVLIALLGGTLAKVEAVWPARLARLRLTTTP